MSWAHDNHTIAQFNQGQGIAFFDVIMVSQFFWERDYTAAYNLYLESSVIHRYSPDNP